MKNLVLYLSFLSVILIKAEILSSQSLANKPDWNNKLVFRVNQEPASATMLPYFSEALVFEIEGPGIP